MFDNMGKSIGFDLYCERSNCYISSWFVGKSAFSWVLLYVDLDFLNSHISNEPVHFENIFSIAFYMISSKRSRKSMSENNQV